MEVLEVPDRTKWQIGLFNSKVLILVCGLLWEKRETTYSNIQLVVAEVLHEYYQKGKLRGSYSDSHISKESHKIIPMCTYEEYHHILQIDLNMYIPHTWI